MSKHQDITLLWENTHPHLRPLAKNATLLSDERLEVCQLCRQKQAVRLGVRLQLANSEWRPDTHAFFCHACQRYSLHPAHVPTHAPRAVDARLWSRAPEVLNLEPTTRCNFNCWYCIGRHMKQADIRVEDFRRALDHCPDIKLLALVGEGEPLLHKGFFDMAAYARERGMAVATNSNGSTFSTSLVQKICAAEILYISISIDAVDPPTFSESRIDGRLEQVWESVDRLVNYRDAHGYRYPVLSLKGTLFEHTKNSLPDIIRAAKQHGFELLEGFQVLNAMSNYVDIYPADKRALLKTRGETARALARDMTQDSLPPAKRLASARDFMREHGINPELEGNPNGIRKNCDEKWIYALLSGDVTPCCQIKTPQYPEWNLFTHSLASILQDKNYENTRFNLWNGVFPNCCAGCFKV